MVRPAPAALRATQILDFLIAHPTQGFTLSQIARANDINVATARTVLAVLTDAGYVVRQGSNRTFGLGPLLVAAGSAALERYPAVGVAREEINRVSREFGVELLLTVAAGNDIVAVARAGRAHPRGIDVGRRVPLIPPLGAVFTAWSSEEEIENGRRAPEKVTPQRPGVTGESSNRRPTTWIFGRVASPGGRQHRQRRNRCRRRPSRRSR